MRNNHTLTYNETTYVIQDGKTTNPIYINGYLTDWYLEYDIVLDVPQGIRLKNRNDEYSSNFYLYLNTTQLQFHHIVRIIISINEESFRNK
jgi:hypothetical protein